MTEKKKSKRTATTIVIIVLTCVFIYGCKSKSQTEKAPADTTQKQTVKEQPVSTTQVRLTTNLGDILIELDTEKAPITTANFLKYVEQGHYDGTIFHRVIPGFMIQGGGFNADMQKKKTNPPIKNEASNGLKNLTGTIAMARTPNPNSATNQFFINLVDNAFLDYNPKNPGYAVFGKVIEGIETVKKIGAVKTGLAAGMKDVPVQPVVIESAKVVTND